MMESWIKERPHLRRLADRVRELFALADEADQRGRTGGEAVDYGTFEQQVSHAVAGLECAVHQAVLSSLDVDAPFVRVW